MSRERIKSSWSLFEDARPNVDRDAGVIRGVRVLGKVSKNGREYSESAMKEAVTLYDGVEVNIDHPKDRAAKRERAFSEGFGELRSPVYRDGAVYADLHYVKSHPQAEQFLERVERFPTKAGLSHNADGEVSKRGGKTVVESIHSVVSVDVVARPATNTTLFESEEAMQTTTLGKLFRGIFPKKHAVLMEMEGEGVMDPAATVEMPSEASSDDQIKAAFRSAIVAAFDDDNLDSKATLNKIKDVLKAYDKLSGGGEKPSPPSEGGGEGKTEETKESVDMLDRIQKLEEQLASSRSENECRALLESEEVEATPVRLKALAAVDKKDRPALVESWKGVRANRPRPERSEPLYEGLDGETPKFKDTKEFLESICS